MCFHISIHLISPTPRGLSKIVVFMGEEKNCSGYSHTSKQNQQIWKLN